MVSLHSCLRCWLKLLNFDCSDIRGDEEKVQKIEEAKKKKVKKHGEGGETRRGRGERRRKRRCAFYLSFFPPFSSFLHLYCCFPPLSSSPSLFLLALRLSLCQADHDNAEMWFDSLIFIIHLAKECFPSLIKEQTMDVCLIHEHTRSGSVFWIWQKTVEKWSNMKSMREKMGLIIRLLAFKHSVQTHDSRKTNPQKKITNSLLFLPFILYLSFYSSVISSLLCFQCEGSKVAKATNRKRIKKENPVILIETEEYWCSPVERREKGRWREERKLGG